MSASSRVPNENARKLSQAILRAVAIVKNQAVADAIQRDDSTISRIVTGESGIKLEDLQPFLACLGFKVVPVGHICVDKDEWHAKETLLRKMIERDHPTGPVVDWNQ